MDNGWSAGKTALALGTSTPRVTRAAKRMGFAAGPNGRYAFTALQRERLAGALGSQPAGTPFTPVELRVLAALSRAPRGLIALRGVAARSGASPTAVARALWRLRALGLVTADRRMIAAGRARRATIWRLNPDDPTWAQQLTAIAAVRLPEPSPRPRDLVVPARLLHLFWNTAPQQLRTRTAGGYIARRLLALGDLDGLAWGAENLATTAWRHAATARGLTRRQRALAGRLAQAAKA